MLGAQRAWSSLHTSTKQISKSPRKIHEAPKNTAVRRGTFTFAWWQAKSRQLVLGTKRCKTQLISILLGINKTSLVISSPDCKVSERTAENLPISSGILMMNFNFYFIQKLTDPLLPRRSVSLTQLCRKRFRKHWLRRFTITATSRWLSVSILDQHLGSEVL